MFAADEFVAYDCDVEFVNNGEIGRMSPAIREIINGYARLSSEERDSFRQMLEGMRGDNVSELHSASDVPQMPGDEP